jgi:hypothetical protein
MGLYGRQWTILLPGSSRPDKQLAPNRMHLRALKLKDVLPSRGPKRLIQRDFSAIPTELAGRAASWLELGETGCAHAQFESSMTTLPTGGPRAAPPHPR